MEGLGVVEVTPNGFRFRDGTHVIETADMAIEAYPEFYSERMPAYQTK